MTQERNLVGWRAIALGAVLTLLAAHAAAEESPSDEPPPPASADQEAGEDLLNMDLEQLSSASVSVSVSSEMSTEVTSVSRTEQPISRTASAVFVITNEMIRRSGARNIPEALRMAPGVHVARISSASWAISIRGFNAQLAKRLLVQIDGRAVYTPIFSGVYWEQQLVPLKDVDRIEVVRGPGGAVWGSNSVNGVINIVTKSSQETQGGYLMAGGGSEHRNFSHARVGGQAGNLTYRVYGMNAEDDQGGPFLAPQQDGRSMGAGGFRMDWTPSRDDSVTFQGDLMSGTTGYGIPTLDIESYNLLARWNRKVDCDTDWSLQTYYDEFTRHSTDTLTPSGSILGQEVFDIDATFHTHWNECHELVCGVGYRNSNLTTEGYGGLNFFGVPGDTLGVISYFVQDTVTLADGLAYFTLGCKMEHNSFVGFVYQPAAKLAVTPDERTSLWASVARAARTPSMVDRDLSYQNPGPPTYLLNGSRSVIEEDTMTYELGVRRQPTEYFYWDLAVFFSKHEHLIGSPAVSFAPLVTTTTNGYDGESYGGELWGTVEMTDKWRLRGYYAYLRDFLSTTPTTITSQLANTSPRNIAYLTSSHDLSCHTTLDWTLRYADNCIGNGGATAGSYLVADVRLGYQPRERLSLSLVGQNLLEGSHLEYIGEYFPSTTVQSGVYGMIEWGY